MFINLFAIGDMADDWHMVSSLWAHRKMFPRLLAGLGKGGWEEGM